MDGIHDLGGRDGFGEVETPEQKSAPLSGWEARVFAMTQQGFRFGAFPNVDYFRHAIERIDPRAYLLHGYYGRWLGGLECALLEGGFLEPGELDERVGGAQHLVAARPQGRRSPFARSTSSRPRRVLDEAPRFRVGQRVRTSVYGHAGHCRLPAYARGCVGTILADRGGWVFPDTHAAGEGDHAQRLYTVLFAGEVLWGERAEADQEVCIDLFESYLFESDSSLSEPEASE